MAHKWQSIKDLDDSFNESVHEELRYLAKIWLEKKDEFDPEQMDEFVKKIKREWSIETGLVERVYHFDRGTTETWIEHGIDKDLISHSKEESQIGIPIITDHRHVIDGLFDFIKGTRELSVGYIKELHSALLQNQDTTTAIDQFGNIIEIPLLRGKFKKHSNNPRTSSGEVHEYCIPEQVKSEMDNLIAIYETHVKNDHPPLAIAAWLHHRFTQIHPFQDGNGRVARCLATLVFIKKGWFPLTIRNNDERDRYLDALKAADTDDLSPLINLFAAVQRRYFLGALGIIEKRKQEPPDTETKEDMSAQEMPITAIIKSATDKLRKQSRKSKEYREKLTYGHRTATKVADNLVNLAHQCMLEICTQINQVSEDRAYAECDQTKHRHIRPQYYDNTDYLTIQHTTIAHHYKYRPNKDAYRSHANIRINTRTSRDTATQKGIHICVLFHGVGDAYSGIIACSGSCSILNQTGLKFLSDEIFQINYEEPPEQAQKRFEEWLDKVITTGLRFWHDSL